MSFQHEYPYGDVHEMNLDWLIQTMQEFINSERAAGNTPTVASVRSFFTHKYPYGDIHELNLDWVIQTALRMEEIGDSVEGDIGKLQTRMTAAETNIKVLDNSVTGLNESVDQIETEIGNINADVDALKTTTAQHTTQIKDLDDKIESQVVANPVEAATDALSKIEIAGTVYTVEGSGGSEVEANPAGEPTDTLEKIGIDGTVYKVSGSEPVSKTATGNPIHIEDAADAPIVSGEVTFEPVQNLHGYDKPWAGGGGFNKIDESNMEVGRIDNSGQNIPATSNIHWRTRDYFPVLPSTVYYNRLSTGFSTSNSNNNIYYYDTNKQFLTQNTNIGNSTFTTPVGCTFVRISSFFIQAQTTYPTGLCLNVSDESKNGIWEPYSNICPIEGYTDCKVEVTDDDTSPTVTNTYTIDLDGTRYGGTVYPVTGKMSDSMGHIASYNGETINEPWLSDRDEYVAGTTPTTGAEVVYTLASPTIVQLTPEQIRTLEGTNNISTNMTGMSLEYITQDYQPLVELIEQSAGHHYSEQERVVGTWIDGKPLYEKSFQVTTPSNNSSTNLVDVTDLNIDHIVSIDGTVKNITLDNVGATSASGDFILWLRYNYENTGKAYVATQMKYSGYYNQTMYIMMQYTKTTD